MNEISPQKLRGGYYTPQPIAKFIADWAIQSKPDKTLEPSCGDGIFLTEAAKRYLELGLNNKSIPAQLTGIEINKDEASKAIQALKDQNIGMSSANIIHDDFFNECRNRLNIGERFNVIIGNPPFIRYQNFPENQRQIAIGIMKNAGLKPNRLMNAWVPFLVGSTLLLKEKSRLGMVIPAELLQVNYSAELRKFLSVNYSRITLIAFKKLLFENVQQEILLFLGEKNGKERTGIRTIELDTMTDLASYEHSDFSKSRLKPIDHSMEKWTQYFLSTDEIMLLRRLRKNPKITRLSDIAQVDVGIVTGENNFFILSQKNIKELSLNKYTKPIVARSAHLTGILFSKEQFKQNENANYPTRLFYPPEIPFENLPEPVKKYITMGEQQGYQTGFKCRIRDNWYIVPSIWTPDAFMLRQISSYPKVILNSTQATSTDTIHRVKMNANIQPDILIASFHNSLTFAFAEVFGRSYGGGVLELEPREAEALLLLTT